MSNQRWLKRSLSATEAAQKGKDYYTISKKKIVSVKLNKPLIIIGGKQK
jgi:hypothetical protein